MILETVFGFLFEILYRILWVFPTADWSIPNNVLDTVRNIIETCCYFLPMDTVVSILAIVIWFNIFKIGVSFIKTLWQIIPFL